MEDTNKKRVLNVVVAIVVGFAIVMGTTGCVDKADTASYNLSREADNFNNYRRLTVINCIQGDTIFQLDGRMSIKYVPEREQLEIVVEYEENKFKKHFVGISDNVTYTVEDITTPGIDPYGYVLNFNPKMWLPIRVKNLD